MLINWFTVIAQILNFLILIWLLKKFLYRPILDAIDAREKYVADKLASAEADRAAAQEQKVEFTQKNEDFDLQRAALLHQAEQEAIQHKLQLLENAKQEIEERRIHWLESLESSQGTINRAIGLRAKQEIFSIARKTLSDLAGANLEESILERFTAKLSGLSQEERALLLSTTASPVQPMLVRTVFELTADQKSRLVNTIKSVLGLDWPVNFESGPDQIAGIELLINDRKIDWNINDYLISLEEKVGELISGQIPAQTPPRMPGKTNLTQGEIAHEPS